MPKDWNLWTAKYYSVYSAEISLLNGQETLKKKIT